MGRATCVEHISLETVDSYLKNGCCLTGGARFGHNYSICGVNKPDKRFPEGSIDLFEPYNLSKYLFGIAFSLKDYQLKERVEVEYTNVDEDVIFKDDSSWEVANPVPVGSNLKAGDKIISIAGSRVRLPRTEQDAEMLKPNVKLTVKRNRDGIFRMDWATFEEVFATQKYKGVDFGSIEISGEKGDTRRRLSPLTRLLAESERADL